MEIRFSSTFSAPDWYSDPEATVKGVVAPTGYAHISSVRGECVRFTIHASRWTQRQLNATQHDSVIRALLTLDPDARVRTARAVYAGLQDFERQVKARTQEV